MSQGCLIGKTSQAKKRITSLIGEVLPLDKRMPYKGWVAIDIPRVWDSPKVMAGLGV